MNIKSERDICETEDTFSVHERVYPSFPANIPGILCYGPEQGWCRIGLSSTRKFSGTPKFQFPDRTDGYTFWQIKNFCGKT